MQPTVQTCFSPGISIKHAAAALSFCHTATAKHPCYAFVGAGTQCCGPGSVPRCLGRMLGWLGTAPLLCCLTTAPCALLRGRCSAPGLLPRPPPAWRLASSFIRSDLPYSALLCPALPCPALPCPALLLSLLSTSLLSNSSLGSCTVSLHTPDQSSCYHNAAAQLFGAGPVHCTPWVKTALAIHHMG